MTRTKRFLFPLILAAGLMASGGFSRAAGEVGSYDVISSYVMSSDVAGYDWPVVIYTAASLRWVSENPRWSADTPICRDDDFGTPECETPSLVLLAGSI